MSGSVFVLQEYGDDGYSDTLHAAYSTREAADAGKAEYLRKHPVEISGRFAGHPPVIDVVEIALDPPLTEEPT